MRKLLSAFGFGASMCLPAMTAQAQQVETVTLAPVQVLGLAENMIAQGKAAETVPLLDALAASGTAGVDQVQVAFLRGMAAAATGDLVGARDRFRDILLAQPNLTRVRLELASALFGLKDDEAAAYNFRLALAETDDPGVRRNIAVLLEQIQQRKRFKVELSLAAAPDSNINAGTANETVNLFGVLPARISDDARETSGIGMKGGLSITWLPELSRSWRGEFKLGGNGTDYSNAQFDDVGAFAEAGFRFVRGAGFASLAGTYDRRWNGGHDFYEAPGGRATLAFAFNPRWAGWTSVSAADYRYATETSRDGPAVSVSAGGSYALDGVSTASVSMVATREYAAFDNQRNTSYVAGIGYRREFSQLTFSASPYGGVRVFDTFDFLFGETRKDVRYGAALGAALRGLRFRGFAPEVTYTYVRNQSNVSVFDNRRHQLEFSLTRIF